MVDALLSKTRGDSQQGQGLTVFERRVLEELAIGASHGQRVVNVIESEPDSERNLARMTYTTLHRLEKKRLVTSAWRPVAGRSVSAKFYWVTRQGVRALEPEHRHGVSHVDEQVVTTLMVLALFNGSAVGATANRHRQAILSLVVDARAQIRSDEIARASTEVTRVLGAIGVRVDWIVGTARRNERPEIRQDSSFIVRVHIVARTDRSDADAVPLGFAPRETDLCSANIVIFQENVDEFARIHGRPPSFVLGLVIAHEIGHILLPKPGHTSSGIMQAPWDHETMAQAEEPGLRFTAKQGALIRNRLNQACLSTASR